MTLIVKLIFYLLLTFSVGYTPITSLNLIVMSDKLNEDNRSLEKTVSNTLSGRRNELANTKVFFASSFLSQHEMYRLYWNDTASLAESVMFEVHQCHMPGVADCNDLKLLASDMPHLTVVTTCCIMAEPKGTDKRNIIYNSIAHEEVSSFIYTLAKNYGWQRFAFIISPQLPNADKFFLEMNQTLFLKTKKNSYETAENVDELEVKKYFFSVSLFRTFEKKISSIKNVLRQEAVCFFFLLEESQESPAMFELLKEIETDREIDNGKAYFFIQWSSFAISLPQETGDTPNGLMILRRHQLPLPGTNASTAARSRENVIFEEVDILLSAVIRSGGRDVARKLSGFYCNQRYYVNTTFDFEFDEHCQRRAKVFEVINIFYDASSEANVMVPVFDFYVDPLGSLGRLVATGNRLYWPGSGWRVPIDAAPTSQRDITGLLIGSSVASLAAAALVGIVTALFYVKWRRSLAITDNFVAEYSELRFPDNNNQTSSSKKRAFSFSQASSNRPISVISPFPNAFEFPRKQSAIPKDASNNLITAMFRGQKVFIRQLHKGASKINSDVLQELQEVRNLQHTNISSLIAVIADLNFTCTIELQCSSGTLAHVLFERTVKLDRTFKLSFANDISAGLSFLHQSSIGSHGRLTSNDILVDMHWFCKISNIPLPKFEMAQPLALFSVDHTSQESDLNMQDESKSVSMNFCKVSSAVGNSALELEKCVLLSTAPELLRNSNSLPRGTQKGDIYSFGIILYEIVSRKMAFSDYEMSILDLLENILAGTYPPFRPTIVMSDDTLELANLARLCLDEIPVFRPDSVAVAQILRNTIKDTGINLVDSLIETMETYASDLQHVVEKRTSQLESERAKCESLLTKILPRTVAVELKANRSVPPEYFESVTISFFDVVGFNKLAARLDPIEIVEFLNHMYSFFDQTIESHDVYKVETVGASYMVASGLPQRNGLNHAGEIATMALDILSCVADFKASYFPKSQLQVRCGMHSGSVVAGVVGKTMPRYCLFGDTVNYASRMESNCLALRIHVSPECKHILDTLGGYKLIERGLCNLKGKGIIKSYYLVGKEGWNKIMPDLSLAADIEDHEFK